jgi:peptide chain release factor 1
MNNSELKIERITGQGPGGQHRNKTASCVRVTHLPTGIQVTIDGRSQHANLRQAKKILAQRIVQAKAARVAAERKARRDKAIKDGPVIRTYDYKVVKDHRTGKTASLKEVLEGHLDDFKYTPPRESYE